MDNPTNIKRRKTDDRSTPASGESNRKQTDTHILNFLKTVISEAQNRNLKKKLGQHPAKRNVQKRDASAQTDDLPDELPSEVPLSPTALLSHYAPSSSDGNGVVDTASLGIFPNVPTNTDLHYYTTDYARWSATSVAETVSDPVATPALTSTEVKQLVNKWMQQYEEWFYKHFGVDVRAAATESADIEALCQTVIPSSSSALPNIGLQPAYSYVAPSSEMEVQKLMACQTQTIVQLPVSSVPTTTSVAVCSLAGNTDIQNYQISRAPIVYQRPIIFPTFVRQPTVSLPLLDPYIQSSGLQLNGTNVNPLFTYFSRLNPAISSFSPNSGVCLSNSSPQFLSHPLITPSPIPDILSTLGLVTATQTMPQQQLSHKVQATTSDSKIGDKLSEQYLSSMLASALASSSTGVNSKDLCGPLTHSGVYGILRTPGEPLQTEQAPVMVNDRASELRMKLEASLPVHMTPPDFESQMNTWMPPPPPTVLLLQKQALICALQIHVRDKVREIESRKAHAKRSIEIDYIAALEMTVAKSVQANVAYVHNRVNCLPEDSQMAFLCGIRNAQMETTEESSLARSSENGEANELISQETPAQSPRPDSDFISPDTLAEVPVTALCEEKARLMYICDVLIGDVFICQGLAGSRRQSKICAARMAMSILSDPSFLVGSFRRWYDVEFLILCLSPKAELVPRLPPFLCDPLESIPSSDRVVSDGDPMETFEIINPKPIEDLWLYTALSISVDWRSTLSAEQMLAQSAEFSQMTVDFEIEFNSVSGKFVCHGLVDGHSFSSATAVNIVLARAQASYLLLDRLCLTQPVVGLLLPPPDPEDEPISSQEDMMHPLWGLTEATIVDSLMWGKEEREFAIPIEHFEAHCEIPPLNKAPADGDMVKKEDELCGFFGSGEKLEHFIQAYAASAAVTPLRISSQALPRQLWYLARRAAHSWGLLTRIEFDVPDSLDTAYLLVCKRVPLPRLKRTLYDRIELGVFYLLDKGNLREDAVKRLLDAEVLEPVPSTDTEHTVESVEETVAPLPNEQAYPLSLMDPDDRLSQMARRFHDTSLLVSVKSEPSVILQQQEEEPDCLLVSAELNQPSNAIEILDDLPRQLIPGIDF